MTQALGPRIQDSAGQPAKRVEHTQDERKLQRAGIQIGLFAAFFSVALAISAALVNAVGGSPTEVLNTLIDGSLLIDGAWGRTLIDTVPMLLVAVGVVVAFRCGLYNIGQEGQVAIGALFAVVVALEMPGPGPLVMTLALIASAVGGGLWAGVAAGAYFWRRVDVLIGTLLLTFIAPKIILYLTSNESLLLDVSGSNSRRASQSEQLSDSVRLTEFNLFGNTLNIAVIGAVLIALVTWYLLSRSVLGLHIRTLGFNERMAQRVGVRPGRVGGGALMFSGATAGLAGGVFLLGSAFRLQDRIANDFGWQGLLVALVARLNAFAVIPVAFFFGVTRRGGSSLRATGVSSTITEIIQALFVIAALLPAAIMIVRDRRRDLRLAVAPSEITE
jgi:simple sugar transport system permease protein